MTLLAYVRALGFRRGIRWWWVAARTRHAELPPFRIHHGEQPSMPGYRRRRRAR